MTESILIDTFHALFTNQITLLHLASQSDLNVSLSTDQNNALRRYEL